MNSTDAAIWWTGFGAIAQAIGALATFAAVAVSLWIALSERRIRARCRADIVVISAGDGSPLQYMVGIHVRNDGFRTFQVTGVGWRTGWASWGPKALQYRSAMFDTTDGGPWPRIIAPGQEQWFYVPIAKVAQSESRAELFGRKMPILGEVPIRATVHITGHKRIMVKVPKNMAKFLRTGEHASIAGGD